MDKKIFYKLLENNLLLNDDSLHEIKQITEQYPFFHAAWMLLLKNLQTTGDTGLEKSIREIAIRIPDRKVLYNYFLANQKNESAAYFLEQQELISNPSYDEDGEREEDQLIDRFLSGDAGPIKIDAEYKPEADRNEVISKSLSESDELITETLANIYFQQKKYDKALDAFKKLSLKYPEKSVYFAARIEEIEKYLK
jgi:tetratricopeptide (TPR) repeat protein